VITYFILAIVLVVVLLFMVRHNRSHSNQLRIVTRFHDNVLSRLWFRAVSAVRSFVRIEQVSELDKLERERQAEDARAVELRKILDAKQKLARSVAAVSQIQKDITSTDEEIASTRGLKQTPKPGKQLPFGRVARH
jgi:heme/copper-type cytochrome/quinol oxidase subunit 2